MQALEVVFMVAALVFMFAAVGAKILTTQLIGRMKRHISQVAQIKSETMGRLKSAQNQKAVIEQNQNVLLSKKNEIAKKLGRMKKEMGTLQSEESQRKQRSSMRKVE